MRDDNLDRYDSGIDNTRMDKGDEPEDSVTNRRALRVIGNSGEGPKFILLEHAYLFRGPALAELSAYEYASLLDVVNETKGSKGSSRVTFL